MKSAAITLATGIIYIAFAISAWAAETNSGPTKVLPARSMLTMRGVVNSPEAKASPLFTGKELPRPPQQKSAWSPPAKSLPTNYVTATALLFEQGLADPRGCDYREIEIGTGNVWSGDGGVVKTHGWVLPGGGEQRFAIGWNGLVYATISVGTNADLNADVMGPGHKWIRLLAIRVARGSKRFSERVSRGQRLPAVALGESGFSNALLAGHGASRS